jgi:hypothetical protein
MTDVFHRPIMLAAILAACAIVTGLLWLALASLSDSPMSQQNARIAPPIPAQLMPVHPQTAVPGAPPVTRR